MAHEVAKRNARKNAARLQKFRAITIILNILYCMAFIYWNESFVPYFSDLLAVAFWFAQQWGAIVLLAAKGKPSMDEQGEIVDCSDLANADELGLFSYAQDTLWVCWISEFGTGFLTSWFWILYLCVPAFAFYKAWGMILSPLLSRMFGGGGGSAPGAGFAPGPGLGGASADAQNQQRAPQNRRERRAAEKNSKR
jgi:hypothetical protein